MEFQNAFPATLVVMKSQSHVNRSAFGDVAVQRGLLSRPRIGQNALNQRPVIYRVRYILKQAPTKKYV